MPRIRTIKPAIWADGDFAELTHEARLLMIGLISFADDKGRFIASPNAIAGYIYPYEDIPPGKVKRWIAELVGRHIELYKVAGREYGWFPNWHKHQVINRAQASTLPPPPERDLFSEPSVSQSVNGSVRNP